MKIRKTISLILSSAMLTSVFPLHTATALTVDLAEMDTNISYEMKGEAELYAAVTNTTKLPWYYVLTVLFEVFTKLCFVKCACILNIFTCSCCKDKGCIDIVIYGSAVNLFKIIFVEVCLIKRIIL